MLKAPENKNFTYELPPKGNQPARLYEIIDFGTQEGEWKGQAKQSPKIRLAFELLGKKKTWTDKDGNEQEGVHTIRQTYTFSLGDQANLAPIIDGLTGGLSEQEKTSFDISTLLGTICLLQVNYKTSKGGNEYAYVASASQMPEGMVTPTPVQDVMILAPTEEYWNKDYFDNLSKYTRGELMKAPEWIDWLGNKGYDLPGASDEPTGVSSEDESLEQIAANAPF